MLPLVFRGLPEKSLNASKSWTSRPWITPRICWCHHYRRIATACLRTPTSSYLRKGVHAELFSSWFVYCSWWWTSHVYIYIYLIKLPKTWWKAYPSSLVVLHITIYPKNVGKFGFSVFFLQSNPDTILFGISYSIASSFDWSISQLSGL